MVSLDQSCRPVMPVRLNPNRPKRFRAQYRIRNWREYEAGLKRRGDLTLWLDQAAIAGWHASRRTTPGGQALYSDLAIELVLTLRLVFHLGLRQAEGFAISVLGLLGLDLPVPDHTTLSRRAHSANRRPHGVPHGPLHLLINSTGLKLFGRGEWNDEKHGRARRSWRKLHLAVDAETGEIVASVLTGKEAADAGQVPVLLEQVQGKIASVMADGAYEGEPVYRAIAARQPQAVPSVVIPPRRSAALSPRSDTDPSQRDGHIRLIQEQGRSAWRKATGHGRRSLVETAIGRYKALIGPRLRSRGVVNQQGEVALGVEVLNRMIRVAKPVSVRIA
jgi:Transposase DDE domain